MLVTFSFAKYSYQAKCAHAWDSAIDVIFHTQQLWRILNSQSMCSDCSIRVFDRMLQ